MVAGPFQDCPLMFTVGDVISDFGKCQPVYSVCLRAHVYMYTKIFRQIQSTTGKYFHYRIQPKEKRRETAVIIFISAFDVLMNAQKEIVWPDTLETLNKKQQMWNDLVRLLKQKGLG